jgi:hypothetical protein
LLRDLSGKTRSLQWCSWRPDGRQELRISKRGDVTLWNTFSGTGLSLPQAGSVTVATYAPDGRMLLTASEDGEVRIWDLCARDEHFRLTEPGKDDFNSDIRRAIHVLYFTENVTKAWYEAGGFDGKIDTITGSVGYRWPDTDNERIQRLLPPGTPFHRGALSPDQSCVVTVSAFPGASAESIQLRADKGFPGPLIQSLQLWDALTGGRVGKRLDCDQTFSISPKAEVEWRIRQLQSGSEASQRAAVTISRRRLAAALEESGWRSGERGNEDLARDNYLQRLWALAQYSRNADVFTAADALAARWPDDPLTLYGCARVYALAAGAVKDDAGLCDRYATRALSVLRQAAQSGFKDGELLLKDSDLDALRQRKDFLQLQRDLAGPR